MITGDRGAGLTPTIDTNVFLLVGLSRAAALIEVWVWPSCSPVIPFTLGMLPLRRLTTAAFGTLMCLEPAIALTIGAVVLGQIPGPAPIIGLLCVITAGIGAERTGSRSANAGQETSGSAHRRSRRAGPDPERT